MQDRKREREGKEREREREWNDPVGDWFAYTEAPIPSRAVHIKTVASALRSFDI